MKTVILNLISNSSQQTIEMDAEIYEYMKIQAESIGITFEEYFQQEYKRFLDNKYDI